MSYQVIARKWRPQAFRDVVGQEHVTRTLENALRTGRIAHAYIFSGTRGVGKTTTARILAKALNCSKDPTAEPCGECDSCREIAAGSSLDVLEIDAASNRGIDQIRELREMVRYVAAGGRYKVVILDEAHQLTDEASNALLKTLEEPPERVVFIMATTQPEDLADTIKSRAQLFQFRSLSFREIADALERVAASEKIDIEPAALAVLARSGQGSLRDAESLLEQAIAYCGDRVTDAQVRELLGVVAEDMLDDMVGAIADQSAERALGLVHRLLAEGQNLQHFCREAIRHVRNLLVAKVCGADSELIAAPADERPRLENQAGSFSEEDLTRFFQILMNTDEDLRRKPGQRLHLELGLLKMVNAARLAQVEEILAGNGGVGSTKPTGGGGASGSAGAKPRTTAVATTVVRREAAVEKAIGRESLSARPQTADTRTDTPAPVAPQAPVPHPAAAPRVVAESVAVAGGLAAAQMESIRAALENQKFLWSICEHVERWELEGGEMRLYFPNERRTLAELLQARDPMERLRTVLNQVMGQPVRVCVKMLSARQTAGRSNDSRTRWEEDPVVREMLKRFGGTLSEVKCRNEG
jgi:DNA polymerase III subunit gamma/tau